MRKSKMIFIGAGFHEYNKYIVDLLSQKYDLFHYGTGEFVEDNPLLHTIFRHSKKRWIKFYQDCLSKFIEETKDVEIDIVFIIKGSYLTDSHLKELKRIHSKAKFVLYLWDSIENIKNSDVLLRHIKDVYSFDSEDCRKYGFKLRPLFYIFTQTPSVYKYDVSFVGNPHSERKKMIKKLRDYCIKHSISYKFVLPVGYTEYLKACFFNRGYYSSCQDIITQKPIPYKKYLEITKTSRVIIDLHHPNQSGLTIRTIEALASGSKVITTNKHIIEYNNIPSSMYYLLSDIEEDSIIDFIKRPVTGFKLDPYYSIESFLEEVTGFC